MPVTELGNLQNNISALPKLNAYNYENLFRVYQDAVTSPYYYNIINTVALPTNLDPSVYYLYTVPDSFTPWTVLSYKIYGTIKLWWAICLANNITNPTSFPVGGTQLQIIKPEYIKDILAAIKSAQ